MNTNAATSIMNGNRLKFNSNAKIVKISWTMLVPDIICMYIVWSNSYQRYQDYNLVRQTRVSPKTVHIYVTDVIYFPINSWQFTFL